jgi:peptide-methionine (R)-S-oxide reductase
MISSLGKLCGFFFSQLMCHTFIMNNDMPDTNEEWKKKLSPEQYKVLREKGTEAAFAGKYYDNHSDGMYRCAGCGTQLFESGAKFDSGTGWPSFTKAIPGTVTEHEDNTLGMRRVEVTCTKCGGHLGHIFPDGPDKGEHAEGTGARLCINSCALDFEPKK